MFAHKVIPFEGESGKILEALSDPFVVTMALVTIGIIVAAKIVNSRRGGS